jgi:alpha-L-fucosidase
MATSVNTTHYDANWDSLMTRPLPTWYDDAKVGIFLHWGVFSVPSFGSEWYWNELVEGNKGGTVGDQKATSKFHNSTYGPDYQYAEFAPQFTATFFDPDAWAAIFKNAGIKYVVLTSKHHEGWTNWCSPEAFNWNACENGPKRNLVADLTASVRSAGLRMGLYHSIFEWYHPLYLADKASNFTTSRYVDEVYYPQAQYINRIYQPDLIWSDGDWEAPSTYWRSQELLAWLYNDGAGTADKLLVNDRWGNENPPIASGKHFGGYFSGGDRQQASPGLLAHKWENAFTLDSRSWGYARNDGLESYLNITAVLYEVVSTVAYGGNALINVGPTADGRIATIFQERLGQLGEWLKVNGEAVYGSRKWREQNDTRAHGIEQGVYYTAANPDAPAPSIGAVYAFAMEWPSDNKLVLTQPELAAGKTAVARLLGSSAPMQITAGTDGSGVVVTIPPLNVKQLPSLTGPWVFELSGVQ